MTMFDAAASPVVLSGLRAALFALAAKGGALFVLAYLVTRRVRSMSAERRHTIWMVVLLVLAILPAAQLAVPTLRLPLLDLLAPRSALPTATVPEPPPAAPELQRLGASETAAGATSGGPVMAWVPLALAGAWAAGALLVAARAVAGRFALALALKSGVAQSGPEALVRSLAGAVGVRRVRVKAHPRVAVPFAAGILRPRILLPLTWSDWSREKLEAVLLHELSHLKRRDSVSIIAAQIACALVWFYPLAWMARAALLREAELSCDRAVLSLGITRAGYASTIVDIFREAGGAPLRAYGPALGRKGMLKDRLTRILRSERTARNPSAARRAKVLALALCFLSPLVLLSVSLRGADPLYGEWKTQHLAKLLCDSRQSWNEDGTGRTSFSMLPDVPTTFTRYLIDKKWTDSDGRTWYHIRVRCSGLPFLLYTVIRLDPSAHSYELTDSPLGYPSGFTGLPGEEKHLVYIRL